MKRSNLYKAFNSKSFLTILLHLIILSCLFRNTFSKLELVLNSQLTKYTMFDSKGNPLTKKFFFDPNDFIMTFTKANNSEMITNQLQNVEYCSLNLIYPIDDTMMIVKDELKDETIVKTSVKKGDKFAWIFSDRGFRYKLFQGGNPKACKDLEGYVEFDLQNIVQEIDEIRSKDLPGVKEVNKIEDLTINFHSYEDPEISISEIIKLSRKTKKSINFFNEFVDKNFTYDVFDIISINKIWKQFQKKLKIETIEIVNDFNDYCDGAYREKSKSKFDINLVIILFIMSYKLSI